MTHEPKLLSGVRLLRSIKGLGPGNDAQVARSIYNAPAVILELIRVYLSGQLQDLTRGAREVELDSASDLGAVVSKLDASFPGLGRRIVDDQGKVRTYVNVFVNNENSRELECERTKLRDGDIVHVLPSVAGG